MAVFTVFTDGEGYRKILADDFIGILNGFILDIKDVCHLSTRQILLKNGLRITMSACHTSSIPGLNPIGIGRPTSS